MSLAIVIELAQRSAAAGGVWPDTVGGWLGLGTGFFSFVAIIVGGPYAYGRAVGKQEEGEKRVVALINGFGERVAKAEASIERINGAEVERVRKLDRIEGQHETVLAAVGRSEGIAAKCQDEAAQHSLELGSRTAALDKRVTEFELEITNRMTRVETKAKINPKEFDDDA